MNNVDKYKRLYLAVSDAGGLPTLNQLEDIVNIVQQDFPIDHGGGNFPTVTVPNNGNFETTVDTIHKLNM